MSGEKAIIAVDFDGTLCENRYPGIGKAREDVIGELLLRQDAGARVILWTCRTGKLLDEAVAWCESRGIVFDAVNENLPDVIKQYGGDTRKIAATEYWDDKAVNYPPPLLEVIRSDLTAEEIEEIFERMETAPVNCTIIKGDGE